DRRHRAEPRVARLELLHDEPVGDVREPGAAVALDVRAEESQLAHAGDQRARKFLRRVALLDHGQRLPLDEAPDARPRHALLVSEELLDAVVVDFTGRHRRALESFAWRKRRPYKSSPRFL